MGVDLVFTGHEHLSMIDMPPTEYITQKVLRNIKSELLAVRQLHNFRDGAMPGSVVRTKTLWIHTATVQSPNQILIEQIAVHYNNKVIDSFLLSKSAHSDLIICMLIVGEALMKCVF
uniref:Uncharacterized protein n=1 Tax=Ditylenchus dipsaci TaxID=166011 RepID=A0A915DSA5_9BILA